MDRVEGTILGHLVQAHCWGADGFISLLFTEPGPGLGPRGHPGPIVLEVAGILARALAPLRLLLRTAGDLGARAGVRGGPAPRRWGEKGFCEHQKCLLNALN